jgi:hypothetical protein
MPRNWLYFFALVLPLIARVLVLNTEIPEWFWYHEHPDAYYFLAALRVHPQFLQFIGGWPLPVFVVSVIAWWTMDDRDEDIPSQFLLLPMVYAVFAIIGDVLVTAEFKPTNLYTFPLIIIPIGYMYIIPWAILIRVLEKVRLVV